MLALPRTDQVRRERNDERRGRPTLLGVLAVKLVRVGNDRGDRDGAPPDGGRVSLQRNCNLLEDDLPVGVNAERLLAGDLPNQALRSGGGKARRVGGAVVRDLEELRGEDLADGKLDHLRVVVRDAREAARSRLVADKRLLHNPLQRARRKRAAADDVVDNVLGDLLGVRRVRLCELLHRCEDRRNKGLVVAVLVDVAPAALGHLELGRVGNGDAEGRTLAHSVVAQRRDAQAVSTLVDADVRREVEHKAKTRNAVDRRVGLAVHAAKLKRFPGERVDEIDIPAENVDLGREVLQRGDHVPNAEGKHHAELLDRVLNVGFRHVGRLHHVVELLSTVDEERN